MSFDSPFHFPEVRIVEASAGSGKTFALAKRYIHLLLSIPAESIPMRQILAITFTNKAALEMKLRILLFLKKIALQQLSAAEEKELIHPLGLSPEKAAQKAFVLMDDLIRHYNFFQVQTIDSFINALLSGCAFKIGLSSNFKIKTNSIDYVERSLDELIDGAKDSREKSEAFEYFLQNYLYLENRTGWFPRKDLLAILHNLFGQSNVYLYPFKESFLTPMDLIKKKKVVLGYIKEFEQLNVDGLNATFTKSLKNFAEAHTNGFDIDQISDFWTREEIPVRKGSHPPDAAFKLWSKIREGLKEICLLEAFSLFNPYLSLLKYNLEILKKISAKDDVLFLEELNKEAGALFDRDYITVEELYYRLATRFHHYLIDEFQDTSRLQWHNLEKMVEEALSTGGSLFYVGDRKQAIYSFRGGDVQLFDDVEKRFSAFNVQKEFLSLNRRSQKAIVHFNNGIFSSENLRRFIAKKEEAEDAKGKKNTVVFYDADYQELEKIAQSAQQSYLPEFQAGYVKMEYLDVANKEERNNLVREKLVALVKDLKQRFHYKEIAILTRSNSEIEETTQWLLEEGILVESERTTNIKANSLIMELVAFLEFLHSPINNLAFTQFLLGEIFSKAAGVSKAEMADFIFSLRPRLQAEKDLYVYIEFRRTFPKLWENFFDPFFKNVGLYPLYELLISILSKYQCLKNFPSSHGYFMHVLNLIKIKEEDHFDLSSFLEFYENNEGEEFYINLTDTDAVRILTVHKSKGLEFPVVILPFLGMDVQVGSRGGDYQQSYVLREHEEEIQLLRLKSQYYKFSDDLFAIYAQEYKKVFLGELNNVYVALTRAQKEMYGFIPKKIGSSVNLIPYLIPQEFFVQGKPADYASHKALKDIQKIASADYIDWIEFLRDEFVPHESLANRSNLKRGEVLHRILSFVEHKTDDSLKKAINQAKVYFPHIDSFDDYEKSLEGVLKNKECEKFFTVTDGEVFCEKEMVNRRGETKRIDRLIVKEKEIWVIDFKSWYQEKEAGVIQVKEYLVLVADFYPNKKVRGFLLFLDKKTFEEVYA